MTGGTEEQRRNGLSMLLLGFLCCAFFCTVSSLATAQIGEIGPSGGPSLGDTGNYTPSRNYGALPVGGWLLYPSVFLGGMIGLALGALVCALTYFGLLRIPGRYLFAATSLMIAFLAAGMASQAVAFLAQADVLTALGGIVWDSSWLLSDSSILGRALHTLVGYSDRPTEMQLLVYAATLAVTFLLMRLFAPVPKAAHAH